MNRFKMIEKASNLEVVLWIVLGIILLILFYLMAIGLGGLLP